MHERKIIMNQFYTKPIGPRYYDKYYEEMMNNCQRAITTTTFKKMPEIKEIIFNNPYTIVRWSDDTETKVRCIDKDIFDKETGVAMAITKKYFQRISPSHRSELKKCIRFAKDYSKDRKKKNNV